MKVLTSNDIRMMRTVLCHAGIHCHVVTGYGKSIRLDLDWDKGSVWGNGRTGFETACFLIWEVVEGAVIRFLGCDSDNSASVLVGY